MSGSIYTGQSFSSMSTEQSDLLQWAVGWQQQWQHRLWVQKAGVAAQCVQLASAKSGYVCPKSLWQKWRKEMDKDGRDGRKHVSV